MTPHLHVQHLDAELSDPAAADRLRNGLRSALDQRLEAALLQAKVDPEADIAIRTLDLEIDEEAGEERWAEALLGGLAEALSRAEGFGAHGGADEQVARFPSRIASGRAALLAVARGEGAPWWWVSLVGRDEARLLEGPRGAERVVLEWITRAPAAAPAAVALLLSDGPGVLGRFGPGSGPGLLRALLDGRAGRAAELASAAASSRPDQETIQVEVDITLAQAVARALPVRERGALRQVEPGAALFFATCLALRSAPGLARPAEVGAALLQVLAGPRDPGSGPHIRPERPAATASPPARPPGAPSPSAGPHAARSDVECDVYHDVTAHDTSNLTRLAAPAASTLSPLAIEAPVGLGGLLFLLRWLVRDPLLADAVALSAPRLATFAGLVLERVLAPLPPEERARVRRDHRLLLEVFAGTSRIEPDPAELGSATAALARLREALPCGLEVQPSAIAWTFRELPDPLGALPPEDRDLGALVLRPGRLRIEAHRAVLVLSARLIDLQVRRDGWDLDPGWFPWVGRTIRFHYEEGP